jgi:hypothetical protein
VAKEKYQKKGHPCNWIRLWRISLAPMIFAAVVKNSVRFKKIFLGRHRGLPYILAGLKHLPLFSRETLRRSAALQWGKMHPLDV